MKIRILLTLFAVSLFGNAAYAQHAGDIEMWYDDLVNPTQLLFEVGESTSDGIALFEAEFEDENAAFPGNPPDWQADEPGFDTHPSFGLTSGHQIWLNLLDASTESSFGVGLINFYNPVTDALEVDGDLAILGNDSPAGIGNLIFDDGVMTSGTETLQQFIGVADSDDEVHEHVVFDILNDDTVPVGAYGFLFELQSHTGTFDGNPDLVSDKFWVVLNRGLSEEDFENLAVPAFGISAIPEPGSAAFLLTGASALFLRRRK